jgi:hypothetical protein
MIKKIIVLTAILAMLSFVGVGFTGEQIFDIVGDKDPAIKFETAERFSQIFWG